MVAFGTLAAVDVARILAADETGLLWSIAAVLVLPYSLFRWKGWTNSEIADDLHISVSTAKTHLASLTCKEARNPVEIAMWAYETGRIKT